MAKTTTDANFTTDVLQTAGTVLVDFYADWCGPCKAIAPVLDELARDKAGSLTVVKVNIDENPMTPSQYGVRSIPTLVLFRNGQVVDSKVGALPKSALYQWVEQAGS